MNLSDQTTQRKQNMKTYQFDLYTANKFVGVMTVQAASRSAARDVLAESGKAYDVAVLTTPVMTTPVAV